MDLNELKKLAGIQQNSPGTTSPLGSTGGFITGTEKKQIEREQNIKPGTDAWFQLWFSRPYMTGEMPAQFRGRKR